MTNDRRIRQKSQRTSEASRGVNGISRRRFLTLATGTGVALSAAARGPWVHAASPGGIELTTFGAPGGFGPPAARAIEVFNQRNEGKIRVRSVVVPFDVHFEKQMTELVTKSTAIDFYPVVSYWNGAMAHQFEDLTPYIDKYKTNVQAFPRAVQELCKLKGRFWSLPFRFASGDLFFYRKDLYGAAGVKVPTNLDQMGEVSARLTKDGVYGLGMMLGGHPSISEEFINWHLALGGRMFNEDQSGMSPANSKHMDLAVNIVSKWLEWVERKVTPPGTLGWTFQNVLNGMNQGLIAQAMMFAARVGVVEDPKQSKVAGKIGYAPLFPGPGLIGPRGDWAANWAYAINRHVTPDRKEAAYKVIEHMTGFDMQLELALKYANGPTRSDVLDHSEYRKTNPAYQAVLLLMEHAYAPTMPEYWELMTLTSDEIGAALTGKKKPRDAAAEIWLKGDQIFKKRAKS